MDDEALAPLAVRVRFSHAAVEWVARRAHVPTLHIKGPAADPLLRDRSRSGTDADVLVTPELSDHLVQVLRGSGWEMRASFANGSVFEHASTLWHPHWGYVDVHRTFPGVGVSGAEMFARLWADRRQIDVAGLQINVPSVAGQALVLVLHAARERAGDEVTEDVRRAWTEADPALRARVTALRDELHAEVAFAAATGDLERYRGHPQHDLWHHMRYGGSRAAEWRARLDAASSVRQASRIGLRALRSNHDHLAMRLGREPTTRERLRADRHRIVVAARDLARGATRRAPRRRGA